MKINYSVISQEIIGLVNFAVLSLQNENEHIVLLLFSFSLINFSESPVHNINYFFILFVRLKCLCNLYYSNKFLLVLLATLNLVTKCVMFEFI